MPAILWNTTGLAATVVIIGIIGFTLDLICGQAIRRASWIRED